MTDSEKKSLEIAEAIGTRFVVTDIEMATGKFYAIATWHDEANISKYFEQVRTYQGIQNTYSDAYFATVVANLHLRDGIFYNHYRLVYESPTTAGTLGDGTEIKYVKIFEIVKGAKIKGKAPPNAMLALYLPIVSNQGREYTILKQTQSDAEGNYEFIVSISQDGPYGVRPTDLYTITDGVSTWQAAVSEQDVLNGGEVVVDIV